MTSVPVRQYASEPDIRCYRGVAGALADWYTGELSRALHMAEYAWGRPRHTVELAADSRITLEQFRQLVKEAEDDDDDRGDDDSQPPPTKKTTRQSTGD